MSIRVIWGILLVYIAAAQTRLPSPEEVEAALQANLRGDAKISVAPTGLASGKSAIEIEPPASRLNRPSGDLVSVTKLQHKLNKSAQRHLSRGFDLHKMGDPSNAATEFEKAIADDPKLADAYIGLGVEYTALERYNEAEAMLRRGIELDPDDWRGYQDLGLLMYSRGDLGGAEQSARRALELSRGDARAHLLLGQLLWRHEASRAEALEHIQYAARTMPEAKQVFLVLHEK